MSARKFDTHNEPAHDPTRQSSLAHDQRLKACESDQRLDARGGGGGDYVLCCCPCKMFDAMDLRHPHYHHSAQCAASAEYSWYFDCTVATNNNAVMSHDDRKFVLTKARRLSSDKIHTSYYCGAADVHIRRIGQQSLHHVLQCHRHLRERQLSVLHMLCLEHAAHTFAHVVRAVLS